MVALTQALAKEVVDAFLCVSDYLSLESLPQELYGAALNTWHLVCLSIIDYLSVVFSGGVGVGKLGGLLPTTLSQDPSPSRQGVTGGVKDPCTVRHLTRRKSFWVLGAV